MFKFIEEIKQIKKENKKLKKNEVRIRQELKFIKEIAEGNKYNSPDVFFGIIVRRIKELEEKMDEMY